MIADVPKTMVYRVARWLNATRGRRSFPDAILTKAPSAELRPNQTDQDSLPPYDVLDAILQRHIEQHQPADDDRRGRDSTPRPFAACCASWAAPNSSASRPRRA